MMSLSGRKINKQIKTHKQILPDMKRTVLANTNVKQYCIDDHLRFTRQYGNTLEGR